MHEEVKELGESVMAHDTTLMAMSQRIGQLEMALELLRQRVTQRAVLVDLTAMGDEADAEGERDLADLVVSAAESEYAVPPVENERPIPVRYHPPTFVPTPGMLVPIEEPVAGEFVSGMSAEEWVEGVMGRAGIL